jgi:hypothetical protein
MKVINNILIEYLQLVNAKLITGCGIGLAGLLQSLFL